MRASETISGPQEKCAMTDYQCLQWTQREMGRHIRHVSVHLEHRSRLAWTFKLPYLGYSVS